MYSYSDFYRDWGPGGEWGLVKSYKVYATGECPKGGSGVIVEVIVNNRAEHEQICMSQKADKTFQPVTVQKLAALAAEFECRMGSRFSACA